MTSLTDEQVATSLVKRLEEEGERLSGHSIDRGSVDAGIASNLASEAAATIERLTARAEAAEERLGRYEAALKRAVSAMEAEAEVLSAAGRSPSVIEALRRKAAEARTALHSSEKANG